MKIASWREVPEPLKLHIQQRLRERRITIKDLQKLDFWIQSRPDVPNGEWFKDFGSFKLCGEGPYPKTFLDADMTGYGIEV